MFKPGQKVRCTDGDASWTGHNGERLETGKFYTVLKEKDGFLYLAELHGKYGVGWYTCRFEALGTCGPDMRDRRLLLTMEAKHAGA